MPEVAPRASSSRQASRLRPPAQLKARGSIIDLSRESESSPPRKLVRIDDRRSVPRTANRAKTRPVTRAAEVIELSDSDGGDCTDVVPRKRKLPTFVKPESKSKKPASEMRQPRETVQPSPGGTIPKAPQSLEAKFAELQLAYAAATERNKKLLGSLEEHVTCEICTFKMWQPYILMCGHTFCLECLQDWFTTTLVQYMSDHPEWTPNPPDLVQARMALQRDLDPITRGKLESHIEHLELHVSQPPYTCPSCRAPVKKRPIEAFALKSVVQTIATAEGEQRPQGTNARAGVRDQPWDGFFPKLSSRS